MSASSRIILAVINDLVGDQRIHRIASTLEQAGFQVCVVGRQYKDSPSLSPRSYQTHRMRLWLRKGKWFYLEYNLRLFLLLLRKRVDLVNANDLDTLLASFLASKWKRIPLVYDSHEYFTEVPELVHRPRTRQIWQRLERWIFPKLSTVYTVNQTLARIYSDQYKVPVQVVRNVPFSRSVDKKSPSYPLLIYQGALNVGRGIELMIQAMKHLPGYKLWIIGRGDIEHQLRAQATELGLEDQVIFRGFVPLEQLATLTSQASLGFSLEEDLGANYRYASPNKIYDYLQAAVPILVSDLPEMRNIVETYKVGEYLPADQRKAEGLAAQVHRILSNREQYQTYVENCRSAAKELNWEREQEIVLHIYQNILNT